MSTTIITIKSTDALEPTSRTNINANFAALNAGKLDISGIVEGEIVSGSGTSWDLANIPVTGSVKLFAGGGRLTPGVDYTVVGLVITTVSPYALGTLVADYRI